MPTDEDISQILCRYFDDNNYLLVEAVHDIRTLFATAETARIQGFADGLAKGIEHRSGRMSARLEIAKDLLAGLDDPTVAEDADIARALAIADALIAESEKP